MKEIEADQRYIIFLGWKNHYCQKTMLLKAIYRFNAVLSNYQWHFFHRTRTKNLLISMETQRTLQITKAVIQKKIGAGGIKLPDFRLYCKATVIKTAVC